MPIIGVGGLNYDIHIKTVSAPVPCDSNPAGIYCSAGGVTRNILENLARLDHDCMLLSAVGRDGFGASLRQECEDAGLDISRLWESDSLPTSTYVSMLDPSGEMFIAANDMRIHEQTPLSYYKENADVIADADAIVTDANLTEAQLEQVFELAEGVPVFADTVSAAKCKRLLPFMGKLRFIKPNVMELAELTGLPCDTHDQIRTAAGKLLESGLESIAVSLGAEGCYYADRSGENFFRKLDCDLPAVNVSGAGDSFVAGFITAVLEGSEPEMAADFALACGKITTLSKDTVDPRITQEFVFRFLDRYTGDR